MHDHLLRRSVLTYDVGGSHISAAICHEPDLRLERVVSAPHPAAESPDAFVGVLYSAGARAAGDLPSVAGAGLAFPGPFDYAEGISRMEHKLPYINGFDLRRALAERFGWKPDRVRFLNDAAAFLLGELGAGAARGASRAVGVTLGTGIGASFSVDGVVVTVGPGVPPGGEIWNYPVNGGILEDGLSSKRIQADYAQLTGKSVSVAEIADSALNDESAAMVFAGFGQRLGDAIRLTLAPFRPDVVVLGGNIARSAGLFLPETERAIDDLQIRIAISTLFDNAQLVGAAAMWFKAQQPV